MSAQVGFLWHVTIESTFGEEEEEEALYQGTIESTFQNFCLRQGAQCARAHVDVAHPHSVYQTYFVALVCARVSVSACVCVCVCV